MMSLSCCMQEAACPSWVDQLHQEPLSVNRVARGICNVSYRFHCIDEVILHTQVREVVYMLLVVLTVHESICDTHHTDHVVEVTQGCISILKSFSGIASDSLCKICLLLMLLEFCVIQSVSRSFSHPQVWEWILSAGYMFFLDAFGVLCLHACT